MASLAKCKVAGKMNGSLLKSICPLCETGKGYSKPFYLSEAIEVKATCPTCGTRFIALMTLNLREVKDV